MAQPLPSPQEPWSLSIIGHANVDPRTLLPHPQNWRLHPESQDVAMTGSLNTLGWVRSITVNKATGYVIDGHERLKLALAEGATTVPVEYVSLTPEQERLALVVFDPLAAMAEADTERLTLLLHEVQSGEAGLQAMLAALGDEYGIPGVGVDQTEASLAERLHRTAVVKIALAVDNLQVIEEALALVGEANRGQALQQICEVYLGRLPRQEA